jgi:hypothetical protein
LTRKANKEVAAKADEDLLIAMLKICGKKDAFMLSLMEQCEVLNTSYIDTGYFVHLPTDYSKDILAKKALFRVCPEIASFAESLSFPQMKRVGKLAASLRCESLRPE